MMKHPIGPLISSTPVWQVAYGKKWSGSHHPENNNKNLKGYNKMFVTYAVNICPGSHQNKGTVNLTNVTQRGLDSKKYMIMLFTSQPIYSITI